MTYLSVPQVEVNSRLIDTSYRPSTVKAARNLSPGDNFRWKAVKLDSHSAIARYCGFMSFAEIVSLDKIAVQKLDSVDIQAYMDQGNIYFSLVQAFHFLL